MRQISNRGSSRVSTSGVGSTVVRDNVARSRYELHLDAGVAVVDYIAAGRVRTLTHAEVPHTLRGSGVAADLVAGALDLARARGEKVVPRCSYIAHFIERHPQYADLVARG